MNESPRATEAGVEGPGAGEVAGGEAPTPASASPSESAAGTTAEASAPASPSVPLPAKRRNPLRRALGLLGRIPHPPIRSRRGLFALFVLIAGFGSIATVAGVVAIQWTETADFCGRCHTMGPELKANAMSAHSDVACAECHVEPGLAGWVKAKINGTRQLIDIVVGQFPKPIPPPAHSDLPPTADTCQRCHKVADLVKNGGPVRIVLKTRFASDEANTKETVALALRPVGLGQGTDIKGVHWHIQENVTYLSADARSRTIDWVGVTHPDGETEQFISGAQVQISSDVQPDIDRLTLAETQRRMDCIDCHNRAGHGIPSIVSSVDEAMSAGRIDPALPYIKKQAVDRLSVTYATTEDAEKNLDGLTGWYATKYPLVAQQDAAQLAGAINELKKIYRLVATPDMLVGAATYPDNLGHQSSPGCFRCHDGNHFKVVDGAITAETIPSTCGTCHTFPQVGSGVGNLDLGGGNTALLVGAKPASHDDHLWVFDHKTAASSADGSGTACAACHQPTYCQGCHQNGTLKSVPHDNIAFDHARLVTTVGAATCAFCHQAAFCERCHQPGSLPAPYPKETAPPSS